MSIRRALTFAWRMALAYLRIALPLTLTLAGGLALLLIIFLILVGFVNWNIEDVFGLASIAGFIAQRLVSLLSLGLLWNIIGVLLGMLIAPRTLDIKNLRTTFPYYLLLYNLLGIPILVSILNQMFGSEPTLILLFLIGVTCVIALYSWRNVVDWYELSEQGITKKKNIPAADKPKIENAETNDTETYTAEDDIARLRKQR